MMTRIFLLVLLESLGGQGAPIINSPLANQFKDRQYSFQRPLVEIENDQFPPSGLLPHSEENKTPDVTSTYGPEYGQQAPFSESYLTAPVPTYSPMAPYSYVVPQEPDQASYRPPQQPSNVEPPKTGAPSALQTYTSPLTPCVQQHSGSQPGPAAQVPWSSSYYFEWNDVRKCFHQFYYNNPVIDYFPKCLYLVAENPNP